MCGEFSFLCIGSWRLRLQGRWLWFIKITRTAAFLPITSQQIRRRQAGGTLDLVHLHQTNADSEDQDWCHIYPERHLHHPVATREPMVPKSKVCHLDMCIYWLLFPAMHLSILMHMPRIASMIKILFQICRLMKKHPLDSTLPTAW